MPKYRGNLKESYTQSAADDRTKAPPDQTFPKGGEVEARDDAMRSKADRATTPSGGASKVGGLPGKAFTGRGGARKRRGRGFTAAEAAAILGKR